MVYKFAIPINLEIKAMRQIVDLKVYPGKGDIILEWESKKKAAIKDINGFMQDTTALILAIGLTKSGFYPKPSDELTDIWKLSDWDDKDKGQINPLILKESDGTTKEIPLGHLKDFYRFDEGTNPENSLLDLAGRFWKDLKDNYPDYAPPISDISKATQFLDIDPLIPLTVDKTKISKRDYLVADYHPVTEYWKKWGPLFKTTDNKTKYNQEVILWGLSAFLWMCFFPFPFSRKRAPLVLEVYNHFFYEKKESDKTSNFWEASFVDGDLVWVAKEKRNTSMPTLSFPNPPYPPGSPDDRINWIREQVGSYFAAYIFNQDQIFNYKIKETMSYFTSSIDNLFLFWLIQLLNLGAKNVDRKLCHCGCGTPLPSHRRKFATDKCANRYNNSQPIKLFKNMVKKWMHDGKITKKKKCELYEYIDELYREGKSQDEVKGLLKELPLKKYRL